MGPNPPNPSLLSIRQYIGLTTVYSCEMFASVLFYFRPIYHQRANLENERIFLLIILKQNHKRLGDLETVRNSFWW